MNCNIWSNDYNPFQKFKLLCWYERMKKISIGNFDAPVNIAFDLCQGTSKKKMCGGISCNFCMSNLEDFGESAHVPRDILMSVPKFFKDWGVLSLCLAGHHSDPFAYNHDDFCQFVRLLYKYDIEAGINSNGIMLDEYLIEDVSRNCKWTGFSINAGTAKTFENSTSAKQGTFEKIINNIFTLTEYCRKHKLKHPVCYKFLITDDNYNEIYEAACTAKALGCRHVQYRPCELPKERSEKIDIKSVEEQLLKCISIEEKGVFEIFGIREKFTSDFKKKQPIRCVATPLGSTWKADGDIVICPDRRWSSHQPNMILGNYIKEGLESIRRKWGGDQHVRMINEANKRIGECIRCTAYGWHDLYENTIENDPMDIRLI